MVTGEEVNFTYDSLNRMITAATTDPSWGLSFGYDGFGNRLSQTRTKGTAPQTSVTVDAHNHITNTGFNYDPNGNQTNGPLGTIGYDVENRVVSGGGTTYAYDLSNHRVMAISGATETLYLYSPGGRKLGAYMIGTIGTSTISFYTLNTNAYFGRKLVMAEGQLVLTDRLGSVRHNMATGTHFKYFPYGEEETTTAQDHEKFATYTRDSATSLDYAMNRYYSNSLGRFTNRCVVLSGCIKKERAGQNHSRCEIYDRRMALRHVKDLLQGQGVAFIQRCCYEPNSAYSILVRVGEEDVPWYCSEWPDYVAFEFTGQALGPDSRPWIGDQ